MATIKLLDYTGYETEHEINLENVAHIDLEIKSGDETLVVKLKDGTEEVIDPSRNYRNSDSNVTRYTIYDQEKDLNVLDDVVWQDRDDADAGFDRGMEIESGNDWIIYREGPTTDFWEAIEMDEPSNTDMMQNEMNAETGRENHPFDYDKWTPEEQREYDEDLEAALIEQEEEKDVPDWLDDYDDDCDPVLVD